MIIDFCQRICEYSDTAREIGAHANPPTFQSDSPSRLKWQKIDLFCQDVFNFIKSNERKIELELEHSTNASQLIESLSETLSTLYFTVRLLRSQERFIGFTFTDRQIDEKITNVENTLRNFCLQIGAPDPSLKKRLICMFNSLTDLSLDSSYKKDLSLYLRSQVGILELHEMIKPFYTWAIQEKKASKLREEADLVQAKRQIEQIFLQYRRLDCKKDAATSPHEKKLHQQLDEFFYNLSKRVLKGSLDTNSKLIAAPQTVFDAEDISQLVMIASSFVSCTHKESNAKIRKILAAHIANFLSWHTILISSLDYANKRSFFGKETSMIGEFTHSALIDSNVEDTFLTVEQISKSLKTTFCISPFLTTLYNPKGIAKNGHLHTKVNNCAVSKQRQDLFSAIKWLTESASFSFTVQEIDKKNPTIKDEVENFLTNIDQFQDFFFKHADMNDIISTFAKRSSNANKERLYSFVYKKLKEIDPQFNHRLIIDPNLFAQRLSSLALDENTNTESYTDNILNKAIQTKKQYESLSAALLLEEPTHKSKGAKEKKAKQRNQKDTIKELAKGVKGLSLDSKASSSTQSLGDTSPNTSTKNQIKKKTKKIPSSSLGLTTSAPSSSQANNQEKQLLNAQSITELYKLIRHPRVTRWKEIGIKVCYQDPKYSETDEREYEEIALRHDIPDEVTQYVLENSMPISQKSSYGTHSLYLKKASIEWQGRKIDVIIEIAIDNSGTIFHEYASPIKDTLWHRLLELSQLNNDHTDDRILDRETSSVWNYASSSIKRVEDNTSIQFVDNKKDVTITFLK